MVSIHFTDRMNSIGHVTRAVCFLLLLASRVSAEILVVPTTNFTDLQTAVATANSNPDLSNTIQLSSPGTVSVASTLVLNSASAKTLTIEGPSFGALVIDGQNSNRLFFVTQGTVTLRNLTLANGTAIGGDGGDGNEGGGGGLGAGGAIFAAAGTLNLENVSFSGNSATGGTGGESSSAGIAGGAGGGGLDLDGANGASGAFAANGGSGGGPAAGAGGAGATDNSASPSPGATGGDYSGGGGGGTVGSAMSTALQAGDGGTGGFGGGGGGAGRSFDGSSLPAAGGVGGFGGGGGGSNDFSMVSSAGGFAGGAGGIAFGGGGGGGALGGAIFVRDGAELNISYAGGAPLATIATGNTATGGAAGGSASNGVGYGSFAFLNGSAQILDFDVGFPFVRTLEGSIDDDAALTSMGTAAKLRKNGLGTLVLAGDGQSSDIEATNGTVQVDGDWSSANITLSSFGRLSGTGSVNDVVTLSNNTVTAGTNFVPGVLSTGNLALSSFGGTLLVKVNGTGSSEHDIVQVNGTVTLGVNSVIVVSLGYTPSPGDSYVILENDGVDPVVGEFTDLPEGAFFQFGGVDFQISYVGGDGNDIELIPYVAEIDVLGNGISIPTFSASPSPADDTDFGVAGLNDAVTHTFTITNSGNNFLYLTGVPLVFIGGDNPGDFTVTAEPSDELGIPDSTTFQVTFQPIGGNLRTAIVSISNSDPDETPYNFVIQGTGPDDFDNDGDPDVTDPDDDNDGVLDSVEIADGTNPRDPDSKIERLSSRSCIDWNGFLSSLTQILELRNSSSGTIELGVELTDINGTTRETVNVTLAENDQFDVIANELEGFEPNTYGQLCVSLLSGPAGAVNGELVFYRLTSSSFEYAFATPFSVGRNGSQYLTYNTYYPTQNPAQVDDFVGTYVQISNEELVTTESGELIFYDQSGSVIRTENVVLAPRARVDVAAHSVGPEQTGLLEWRPADNTKKFRIVQNRYYFDPEAAVIQKAISIPAKLGTGRPQSSPFDTNGKLAVLEISNTLSSTVGVNVQSYTAAGIPDGAPLYLELNERSTYHVVLNALGSGQGRNVEIRSSEQGAIISSLLEYGFDEFGLLGFADPFTPKSGFGSELRGSYNNFLGECSLRLANASDAAVNGTLSMVKYDSTVLLNNSPFSVPARGALSLDLCVNQTGGPGYGQVIVRPDSAETIVGSVVRTNTAGDAEFSIALTEQ